METLIRIQVMFYTKTKVKEEEEEEDGESTKWQKGYLKVLEGQEGTDI